MRTKFHWFIAATVFMLLILVTLSLLLHHKRNSSPIIDNAQNIETFEQVEETKEKNVALSEGITQPVEVPGIIDIPTYKFMNSLSPQDLQEFMERDQSMRASQALMRTSQALLAKQAKYFEDGPDFKYINSLPPQALIEYLEKENLLEPELERLTELVRESQVAQAMIDKFIENLKAQGKFHPAREPDPVKEEVAQFIADVRAQLAESNREMEEQKKIVFERRESMDRFSKETRERSARVNAWLERIDNAKSTNTPPSDTKLTHPSTNAWQNDLNTYMTTLDANIVNKYPMATFAQYLLKEELGTYFDTDDSKAFLQSQQKQMLMDITQNINQYLSDNGDYRTDKISFIRERLSQYWDADVVEQISKQLE